MINDGEIGLVFVGEEEEYEKGEGMFGVCGCVEGMMMLDWRVGMSREDGGGVYLKELVKLGENVGGEREVEEV